MLRSRHLQGVSPLAWPHAVAKLLARERLRIKDLKGFASSTSQGLKGHAKAVALARTFERHGID